MRDFPFASGDREQVLSDLLERERVAKIRYPSGCEGYYISGYENVKLVLSDHRRFSRELTSADSAPTAGAAPLEANTIATLDPPEHARLRRLVAPAFSKRAVRDLEAVTRGRAEVLMQKALECESVDLIQAYARPLPAFGIIDQMGIDPAQYDEIICWSDRAMAAPQASSNPEGHAFAHLRSLFAGIIDQKEFREHPPGLLADLVQYHREERVSEFELLQLCATILVAGHETTASVLGKCLQRLLQYPGLRSHFWEDPEGMTMELMRVVSGGGGTFIRITTEPVEIEGVRIPAGVPVSAAPAGANKDPEVYDCPQDVRAGRRSREPLTFGAGVHRCLGEHLAKVQIRTALEVFLTMVPRQTSLVAEGQRDVTTTNQPLTGLVVDWGRVSTA